MMLGRIGSSGSDDAMAINPNRERVEQQGRRTAAACSARLCDLFTLSTGGRCRSVNPEVV
jgi:hypothetical protein